MVYYFSPLYHVAGLIYLVPVALAFMLLRENKTAAAYWILLPAVLLWLALRGLSALMGDAAMMNMFMLALLSGFVTVLLLGERIGHRHRLVTFLLAGLILMGCIMLAQAGIGGLSGFGPFVMLSLLSAAILLCGFSAAGFLCRRRCGGVKFSMLMILGLLVSTLVFFGVYILFTALRYGMGREWLFFFFVVPIYAGLYWLFVQPFVVLFFVNDFWRRRFAAVMGFGARELPPAAPQESPGPEA